MIFLLIFFFHIQWLVNLLDRIPYIKKFHRFFDIMGDIPSRNSSLLWASHLPGLPCSRSSITWLSIADTGHTCFPDDDDGVCAVLCASALPSLDIIDVAVRNGTAAFPFWLYCAAACGGYGGSFINLVH